MYVTLNNLEEDGMQIIFNPDNPNVRVCPVCPLTLNGKRHFYLRCLCA